jgi:hypothetical protein
MVRGGGGSPLASAGHRPFTSSASSAAAVLHRSLKSIPKPRKKKLNKSYKTGPDCDDFSLDEVFSAVTATVKL